ncbi:ribonuclease D [Rubrimonas cliftonensis]|uniref:Ribonuclease D n=1 Tax=Rubrimonas cliftonensis TaxID=89524 RepID=A0A1H3VHF4_9RHOB|nr:ribonuclease D [Rubrimonas cliftonensis]SDZ73654.1 ribonuclease D [Rubrimonas cliftonensis]
MSLITDQASLDAVCAEFAEHPYVAVDTEFMRERTYWPQLCLVQLARPGADMGRAPTADPGAAVAIDPVEGDLDLSPLFALMANPDVVKVFHASRQDVEIFHNLAGVVPAPMFDTQVAAMVCGYGDQVGYETLVRKIARQGLDKSSRFTDWMRRPLSEKQVVYALGDVTHLRVIYEKLSGQLKATGRGAWVAEEMAVLTDPATYENDPETAWRRLRTRSNNPKFLTAAQALAAWREREAQARDVPRSRVLKDDALLEIASSRPRTLDELGSSRLLQREGRKPATLEAILSVIAAAEAAPRHDLVAPEEDKPQPPPGAGGLVELLKVLLKAKCDAMDVAQKLVASSADLDALAALESPDIPALSGWRRAVFGEDALRLKRGEIALSATDSGVRIVEIA